MRASLIFELPGPKGSCIYLSTYSLIQMFSNILIVQGQGHALCLKSVGKFDTKKPRRSLQSSWLAIYFEFYSSATPSWLTKDSIHSIFHKFSCFFFLKSSNNRNCSDSMNIRRKSFAWLINLRALVSICCLWDVRSGSRGKCQGCEAPALQKLIIWSFSHCELHP